MEQAVWQTEPGGGLVTKLGEFRLVVERLDGWVRYQVFRHEHRSAGHSPVLLESGNKSDVRAAMDAAEQVAAFACIDPGTPAAEAEQPTMQPPRPPVQQGQSA